MLATLLLLGGVTVTLSDKVQVRGLDITVEEIAVVKSDDPAAAARVAAASLGYAPAPGYHRVLRADLVQFDLRRALPGIEIDVLGAQRCRVDPMTEQLDTERLWSLASAELEELFRGTDAAIRRDGELALVEVPLGLEPLELKVAPTDRTPSAGPKTVALQLWIDGDLHRTVHVAFSVSLREPRWVLRKSVVAGEVLDPSMFELRRVEVTLETANAGVPVEALAGTVTTRPIAASSIVTERDIQRPVVIERGDLVTVVIRSGSIEARELGSAMHEAKIGEMVRVNLQTTKREVSGRAKAGGFVEIQIR
jgi:flagella basal body P-ring formation protein FlgA